MTGLTRGDILEVRWFDASCERDYPYKKLETSSPKDFLIEVLSYGVFLSQDKEGILILNEYDTKKRKADFLCIPIKWVKQITTLKKWKKNIKPFA